ncbi:hypothetical protein BABINDRAFT_163425 [Babjeviella inositovora NRRL Y-12698]|uniref:Integral membrane bound transporter domain-containing protein n=1 Tax=Babjeviella inositovora NRRL Y-12698 TaxID=984486 RepID=A0A1E3QJC9_9ASCO|nr:uncharacterized protein BABINDRAFT_163425 [Babjeviella inositovora NRRL Y-12698]ODQ77718.1 hypothetical protein BABINDRAFT_163425 [Babjeviella inositovora NRRL Y-12698]
MSSPNHPAADEALSDDDDECIKVLTMAHQSVKHSQRLAPSHRSDFSFDTARRTVHRQGSLILPETGERVHIQSYIREHPSFDDETTLLISNHTTYGTQPPVSTNRNLFPGTTVFLRRIAALVVSEKFRAVMKCALTYLLASLAVYYQPLSDFIGHTDSKHVVATVAVYFHPYRTRGSMYQSLIFVSVSIAFSFAVSFSCGLLAAYCYTHGQDELSYVVDLVCSSAALGVISFWKQKISKPTFNTACSLASISIISTVIREGSLHAGAIPVEKLKSTFGIVCLGTCLSCAVCFLIWPTSAVDNLRASLNESCNLMSSLLSNVSHKFLVGENINLKDAVMLYSRMKLNIASLNASLEEAQYELYVSGREGEYGVFKKLVSSTTALVRLLDGLRGSAEMQWMLLQAYRSHQENPESDSSTLDSFVDETLSRSQSFFNAQDVNDVPQEDPIDPYKLFDVFVFHLGPSLKSFIFTIKAILKRIPFELGPDSPVTETLNYQHSLASAIDLFNEKQQLAIQQLYKQQIFSSMEQNIDLAVGQEEVAASCGNFSSVLKEFANELKRFLECLEEYGDLKDQTQTRTFNWLKFWNRSPLESRKGIAYNHPTNERNLNSALTKLTRISRPVASKTWNYRLWDSLRLLKRVDIQLAFRVGIGAFCISIFAFLEPTRQIFTQWRGEWALVIYSIMMNKSTGGTSMTVKWRFLGTFMGAYGACLVWYMSGGHPYALALVGAAIAVPSFYIIIYWKANNAFGRFILLTYNLTALYSYSMTMKDDEDGNEGGDNPIVGEIAFHRFVAVALGVCWALIMANFVLPNSARSRLKRGLAILWLRMGVIWNSDPLSYSYDPETMLTYLVGIRDQQGVRGIMNELESLLKQAPMEYRLKGNFPEATYSSLLKSTTKILDSFQNLSTIIELDRVLTPNEEYVVRYTAGERKELQHRIFLILYMVASAVKLGFPIPSKPASIDHAKDRMLTKLHEVRHRLDLVLQNEDYVLLYSYVLVTSNIVEELDIILELVLELYGSVSESALELM